MYRLQGTYKIQTDPRSLKRDIEYSFKTLIQKVWYKTVFCKLNFVKFFFTTIWKLTFSKWQITLFDQFDHSGVTHSRVEAKDSLGMSHGYYEVLEPGCIVRRCQYNADTLGGFRVVNLHKRSCKDPPVSLNKQRQKVAAKQQQQQKQRHQRQQVMLAFWM